MNHIDSIPPGFDHFQFAESDVEALLGRKSVSGVSEAVKEAYRDKIILITGAAGSIGSELSKQLLDCSPKQLLVLDQSENGLYHLVNELQFREVPRDSSVVPVLCDITNEHSMSRVFANFKPQVILHAAAYKHVPMMEEHPFESVNTNVFGSVTLANLAIKYKAEQFVFISSDKAVNPANVMGACKRAVELLMNTLNSSSRTRFFTTRFGNVIGSSGSAVSLFQRQVKMGRPITLTDPAMTRYFMTTHEACTLVLESGVLAKGGEIFVFDMGDPIKILDLLGSLIRMKAGKQLEDIDIDFIGLRPGEKLQEELYFPYEQAQSTNHPKIQFVTMQKDPAGVLVERIEAMRAAYDEDDENGMIRQLKLLVPEYISKASRFSTLD